MGTRGGFLDSFHKCPDYLGSVLRLAGSRGHWHSCYLQGAEKGRQCWDGFCAPRSIKRAGLLCDKSSQTAMPPVSWRELIRIRRGHFG